MKVSAVIITYNEARNIERCLKSLSFCEEIVIVDAFSTDDTEKIAKKYVTHFETREWKGYTEQKNYANTLVHHDWILSVDADEEVSPELRDEIETAFATTSFVAYSIPRKTYYSGHWIRYGGWYPNRVVRLFNRKYGSWVPLALHEYWKADGPVGKLKEDLLHYSFQSIADQVDRNNHYSSLGSRGLIQEKRQFSTFKMLTKPCVKFFENYFLKRGFLDGYIGFIIAVSSAYSVFLKWAKLWEFSRETDR